MNYRPVFIAGCDRSGTTLLGDLLGNSRWSVTTPESQFLHDLLIQLQVKSFATTIAAARWLSQHFRFAAWGLPLNDQELATLIDLEHPRVTIENLIRCYVAHTHPDKTGADIWIDHTPDNFKYQTMLKRLFPEARYIHIVRDGRAVCASIKPLDWGPNNAYTASRHWAQRLQEGLAVEVAEDTNCLRVHYEDLLDDPAGTLRRLCEYIDMPFEAGMLAGGGLQLPEFTTGQHSLVGRPLDPTRADRWRRLLSHQEVRDFESYPLAYTLLNQMGYTPSHPAPPVLSSLRVLRCYCHEFVNYLRNRRRHLRMESRTVAGRRLKADAAPDIDPEQQMTKRSLSAQRT
jgi:hypothetical protein